MRYPRGEAVVVEEDTDVKGRDLPCSRVDALIPMVKAVQVTEGIRLALVDKVCVVNVWEVWHNCRHSSKPLLESHFRRRGHDSFRWRRTSRYCAPSQRKTWLRDQLFSILYSDVRFQKFPLQGAKGIQFLQKFVIFIDWHEWLPICAYTIFKNFFLVYNGIFKDNLYKISN